MIPQRLEATATKIAIMTTRQRMLAAGIAVQVLVPLVALLGGEPPTRLGFQMYSGTGKLEIRVEDERGSKLDVDLGEILAVQPRIELDWTRRLPEALCGLPGAARVTVTRVSSERTMTC